MTASSPDPSASARASAVRWFGRLQLIRLLGKSERTMAWQVADPRSGQELLLVLPRVQPADAAALQYWQQAVRQASRLNHPQLAAVVEYGVQDGWPFVAYDPRDCATLAERNSTKGLPGVEAAGLAAQALQGLAFAHEAGVAHHDLQPYLLLLSDSGQVRVAGLAVASEMAQRAANVGIPAAAPASDTITLSAHRMAAERDVLALGVLLHSVLAGSGALEDADVGRIILRLHPTVAHSDETSCACPGPPHTRSPSRCAPSSTAPPTVRSAFATAMPARCCARWKVGCRPTPPATAARWPC